MAFVTISKSIPSNLVYQRGLTNENDISYRNGQRRSSSFHNFLNFENRRNISQGASIPGDRSLIRAWKFFNISCTKETSRFARIRLGMTRAKNASGWNCKMCCPTKYLTTNVSIQEISWTFSKSFGALVYVFTAFKSVELWAKIPPYVDVALGLRYKIY